MEVCTLSWGRPELRMSSIWKQANQQLRDLISYEPCKRIGAVARELGLDPWERIKLASNFCQGRLGHACDAWPVEHLSGPRRL